MDSNLSCNISIPIFVRSSGDTKKMAGHTGQYSCQTVFLTGFTGLIASYTGCSQVAGLWPV
jgi:hypothetical protein